MPVRPGDRRHVDHIDGNKLNNQRSNLRICSHAGNMQNRSKNRDNTSGYRGVYWHAKLQKWMAKMTFQGRQHYAGFHLTREGAAAARDALAKKLHGEFFRASLAENE